MTINLDSLTIGQAKEIAAKFGACASTPVANSTAGRKVIVRSRDAGVLFGELDHYEYTPAGAAVHLRNARQMWSWTAAEGGTLADCATHGVKGGKFSAPAIAAEVIGACTIIDCTDKAVKSLESAKWA